MHQARIWSVFFIVGSVLIVGLALTTGAEGSGTAYLPQNFTIRGHGITRQALQLGKALFDNGLEGSFKACRSCHDSPVKLDARSLDPKVAKLSQLINACLADKERCGGKALDADSKEVLALEAWLTYRYRLRTAQGAGR